LDNITVQMVITVRPAPSNGSTDLLAAPIAVSAVAVVAGAAYALLVARRRRSRASGRGLSDAAPYVVPGSDRPAPPPPPPKPSEVEAQIAVAREAISELEQLGVETNRATKMLGLAISFFADENLEMASQYSKKAAKLARDQKQRKESEVDEETARRFVTDTQKMLESTETAGLNTKEAKKLFGLSISFLAEGNYVTGMQYSKKVRRILEELQLRQETVPATKEAVEAGLESAEASIAELRRIGEDTAEAERLLDMARTFVQEEDYQPARGHLLKARATVSGLKEKGRPFTAQQWKDKLNILKERMEKFKGDGLRTEEPMKMLRHSESFALQGNLEVASQYVRKAEKLLNDMEDRAKTYALKKEAPAVGPLRCPRCGEESEADWVVCAYCNARLKAEPPATPDGGLPLPPDAIPKTEGEIRIARPVEDDEEHPANGPVREVKKAVKLIRPGNR
jgi:predicted Zn-ribbon and HTH transcriptional regulator